MKKKISYYYIFILFISFVSYVFMQGTAMAQVTRYDYVPVENPDHPTNDQIGEQCVSADLNAAIAPRQLNGELGNLVNDQRAIVSSERYAQEQEQITYSYDDHGAIVSSTDQFGNVISYANGKPTQITDSNGIIIAAYTYADNKLSSFTDQDGNTTFFYEDTETVMQTNFNKH